MNPLYILACIGLAVAATVELKEPDEKSSRSIILPRSNCLAQWQANNPCTSNPLNQLNFPLAGDITKFIQCGTYGRMFIVQCPAGEVYDQATTTCIKANLIVAQPVQNTGNFGLSNPCTSQNIAAGKLFFGLTADNTKFVQCVQNGNAQVLTCPAQMVWDQTKQSCVFPRGALLNPGTQGTGVNSLTGLLSTSNPCTTHAISTSQLYFSHPDPTKFIQCDLHGNPFVQQCPAGLVWNQYEETCANQLTSLTGVLVNGGTMNGFLTG